MDATEARRLNELEIENTKLNRIVAKQILDRSSMKELLANKLVTPAAKRKIGECQIKAIELSERKAFQIVGLSG